MAFDPNTGQVGAGMNLTPACRLLFCADWAPIRAYANLIPGQPGAVYSEGVRRELAAVDIRIVNVEAVLHASPESLTGQTKEGPPLIGPAGAVNDLKAVGFDIALLANNHIYDFGRDGVASTRGILERAGLRTCGTGSGQEDAYDGRVLRHGGIEVALVNFQEGEEGSFTTRSPEVAGWDLARVRASVRRHAAAGRTVVALPHADREFLPFPAPYAQEAYRSLVDAGAALVVGHHPHVPRGVEIYKDTPIFYSQGNFLFSHDHAGFFRRLGYMVRVEIDAGGRVGCRMIPYRLDAFGVHLLNDPQRRWFFNELAAVSGEHLTADSVHAWWHAAIDAIPVEAWYASCTGMDYTFARMREGDPVGLARLRTRLSSPSHYHFMIAGISRVLARQHGQTPKWMIDRIHQWTKCPVDDFPLFKENATA